MNDYSYQRYRQEAASEHRTYARDHSYAEWVWFRRWEAGEIKEPCQ
jgi:hypothetical protein